MSQSTILDQIVREIRRVPLARLPEVMATIRGASTSVMKTRTTMGSSLTADELAAKVLELPAKDKLAEIQRAVVLHAVSACDGNISAAARMLGVDRKMLERRVANAKRGR